MNQGFDDIFQANQQFASAFKSSELTGRAARGLAIVTCMDSRIDPLRVVGMAPGDAKILRNAGARVTEDVLRTLVLADRKSTRLNSSHTDISRMPSSA